MGGRVEEDNSNPDITCLSVSALQIVRMCGRDMRKKYRRGGRKNIQHRVLEANMHGDNCECACVYACMFDGVIK